MGTQSKDDTSRIYVTRPSVARAVFHDVEVHERASAGAARR